MRAIKKIRQLIEKKPMSASSQIFSNLILSLESEASYPIKDLYKLSLEDFELAITLLEEWRLDCYYIGKAKAFDVAYQAYDLNHHATNA
jgi:hypothetical protein